jgi:hypothetical protein
MLSTARQSLGKRPIGRKAKCPILFHLIRTTSICINVGAPVPFRMVDVNLWISDNRNFCLMRVKRSLN